MLSLVYKDFLLQRGAKSFVYMLVMPVISVFASSNDMIYLVLPYIAGSYLYIVYANALDDKYGTERTLIAMPVGRDKIVAAKYLSMLIYMTAYLAVVCLLSAVLKAVLPSYGDGPVLSAPVFVQFFTIAGLYYGIFFPLYFRLGYQKSRWVNYISMIASAGIYTGLTKGLSAVSGRYITSIQEGLEYLSGIGAQTWSILLLLGSCVFLAGSLRLSVSFYRRREF